MNIIFGKTNADLLKEKYLVLDLETFEVDGKQLECFCLVDSEKIAPTDYALLDHYTQLHRAFVDNLKTKNYNLCRDLIPHLLGKFGGELDSFYQTINERIMNSTS